MNEIYMLNKGDSIDRIKYEYNLKDDVEIKYNSKFDFKYVELKTVKEGVFLVKNYLPIYEYKYKSGDTIMEIMSRGYEVDHNEEIFEGDTLIIKKPKSNRYIVSPLETLADISAKFGVTEKYIMEVNDLKTNRLFVGQILWI